MKWIKKNWQIILIVLLAIFGLSKCTQSCNRQGKFDRLQIEYNSLDSAYRADTVRLNNIINEKTNDLNVMTERVNGLDKMNKAVEAEQARTDEANKRAQSETNRANSAEQREAKLKKELDNSKKQ